LSGVNNPVIQALIATCCTWAMTAVGASFVFFVKKPNRKTLNSMLGFTAGVMIAASYWSLLAPAIAIARHKNMIPWAPVLVGFSLGSLCIWLIDKILPHLHPGFSIENKEGCKTNWQCAILLVLAITLHNIPEGLAVGIAFGATAHGLPSASLAAAITLAIGIGLQNFPEGFAVAMPLRGEGLTQLKSFWFGQLSAVVEPVAAVLGALAVTTFHNLLPYAMAFAAGAMIYVVVEEVIPESHLGGYTDLATVSTILGFLIMMVLDVAFG